MVDGPCVSEKGGGPERKTNSTRPTPTDLFYPVFPGEGLLVLQQENGHLCRDRAYTQVLVSLTDYSTTILPR